MTQLGAIMLPRRDQIPDTCRLDQETYKLFDRGAAN